MQIYDTQTLVGLLFKIHLPVGPLFARITRNRTWKIHSNDMLIAGS